MPRASTRRRPSYGSWTAHAPTPASTVRPMKNGTMSASPSWLAMTPARPASSAAAMASELRVSIGRPLLRLILPLGQRLPDDARLLDLVSGRVALGRARTLRTADVAERD